MVLVKIAIIIFNTLRKRGQENVFYKILKKITDYLDYKCKKLKKSKNWDFSKGISSWFR